MTCLEILASAIVQNLTIAKVNHFWLDAYTIGYTLSESPLVL